MKILKTVALSVLFLTFNHYLKAQKPNYDSIVAAKNARQEKLDKMQKIWASQNTGNNDPMIIAKKFVQAFFDCNIEEQITLSVTEYNRDTNVISVLKKLKPYYDAVADRNWHRMSKIDSTLINNYPKEYVDMEILYDGMSSEGQVGNIPVIKSDKLEGYFSLSPSDKIKAKEEGKAEAQKDSPNQRITQNYNLNDYSHKGQSYKEASGAVQLSDDITKPLFIIQYLSPTCVKFENFITCDVNGDVRSHATMLLGKIKGKWYVTFLKY